MVTSGTSKGINSVARAKSETATRVQIITEVSGTIRAIIRGAVPVLMTFFLSYFGIYRSAAILAGKQTGANILVSILGSMKVACATSLAAGVGGIYYGRQQNKLRKRTIKRLSPLAASYEKSVDPGRGSSGLTSDGQTPHQEDEQEEGI